MLFKLASLIIVYYYFIISYAQLELSQNQLVNIVKTNMKRCEFKIVNSFDKLMSYKGNISIVYFHKPSIDQYESYLIDSNFMNSIYTKSNPELGMGKVNGTSIAQIWVNSNKKGWAIPIYHPRNQLKQLCLNMALESGNKSTKLYFNQTTLLQPFYIMKFFNVFIHDNGIVGLHCGYYQSYESCETPFKFLGKKFRKSCNFNSNNNNNLQFSTSMIDSNIICDVSKSNINNYTSIIHNVSEVFVVTTAWDYNYHHLIVECLLRLYKYYNFLQINKSIKIQLRGNELLSFDNQTDIIIAQNMRNKIIEFLDFNTNRFSVGAVRANVAYYPRAITCSMLNFHALELREMSKWMILKAKNKMKATNNEFIENSLKKPLIILQHRECQILCNETWREMNNTSFDLLYNSIKYTFINYNIIIMNSFNNYSYSEEILLYNQADILIGLHGAGMTNLMFMKPNGLLVEIVGEFEGRILPLCGHYGPFAAIFNINHYIYYWDWKSNNILNTNQLASESLQFYNELKIRKKHK